MASKRTTRASQRKTKHAPARAKRAKTSRAKPQDAIAILVADHDRVKALFRKFGKLKDGDPQRAVIAEQTCHELEVHAKIEELVFYPGVHEKIKEGDLVDEAAVEHDVAKQLIAKLRATDPDDEKFGATYKVLTEYVGHHVEEEEEELFPQVRKAKVDLIAMAEELEAARQKVEAELGGGKVPPAKGRVASEPRSSSRH